MKVGITSGDINGIGLEVILKVFADKRMLNQCTPIIYGSEKSLDFNKKVLGLDYIRFRKIRQIQEAQKGNLSLISCGDNKLEVDFGKETKKAGEFARQCFEKGVADLKNDHIDVLVTAPINKSSMKSAGFQFQGHTDYLQANLAGDSLMMMVADQLRVAVVTDHVPLSNVPEKITTEEILKKIEVLNDTLKIDFEIDKPNIALLGLNPHAGENGALGEEEKNIIGPALKEAKDSGISIFGPFPADGFFGSSQFTKFDAILAMYHDQGLIPFKTLAFNEGVNFTAGLSRIRTSPDHGTAFDLAGKNQSDPTSMRKAIFAAIDIWENRKKYFDIRKNALVKKPKNSE
jgi:4-hydroxythreonine-4-phosphate dehydrogenase